MDHPRRFFKGAIASIAQTPDGYLWLGTEFGLLRFHGVQSVPWQPPTGERLPDGSIRSLLVARDGRLWIGTLQGLASWKDGKLTHYPELVGQSVQALLEDRGLRLQVVDELLPEGRAKEELEQSLELGDQAIAEGRNAVQDLRSSATTTNDLAQAMRSLGHERLRIRDDGQGMPPAILEQGREQATMVCLECGSVPARLERN